MSVPGRAEVDRARFTRGRLPQRPHPLASPEAVSLTAPPRDAAPSKTSNHPPSTTRKDPTMTTQDTTLAHRYDCPTHDGKQCDNHCTFTPNQILTWHADDIATVTGESPATSLTALATQLSTASSRMEDAGINNAEDLDTASTYISDASNLTGTEQAVLLKQASDLLNNLTDMVDEYRDTV